MLFKIKVKKEELLLFIQLELFMIPVGLMQYKFLYYMWYGCLAFSIIYIWMFLLQKRKYIFSKTIYLIGIYLLLQMLATLINKGNWIHNLFTIVVVISLCCFVEDKAQTNYISILKVAKTTLFFNIITELILYLIFNCSILGSVQAAIIYYTVWASLSIASEEHNKLFNRNLLLTTIFFILATIIRPDIGNNYDWTFYVIAIIVLLSDFVFNMNFRIVKYFNGMVSILAITLMNLVFVFLQIQDKIPGLRFIVEDVMHKDLTITGRTGIWIFAQSLAKDSFIWGYGTNLVGLEASGKWYDFMKIYGPHNQFLYVLLAGGIITLVSYIFLLYHVFGILYKHRKEKSALVYSMGLFVAYIELMMTYRTILNCMPLFMFFILISFEKVYTKIRKGNKK